MNMMSIGTILSAAPSPSEVDLACARRELRNGHLLAVPTDTVRGISVDAASPGAVTVVLVARCRGRQMLPPVFVVSTDAIDLPCVDIPEVARALAYALWPGGLTLILCTCPDLGWGPGGVDDTTGVHMPNQAALLCFLHDFGSTAVAPTNLTGRPPVAPTEQTVGYFGTRVFACLNDGLTQGSMTPSIVDFAYETPHVLRFGAIFLGDLSVAAGVPVAPVEGAAS